MNASMNLMRYYLPTVFRKLCIYYLLVHCFSHTIYSRVFDFGHIACVLYLCLSMLALCLVSYPCLLPWLQIMFWFFCANKTLTLLHKIGVKPLDYFKDVFPIVLGLECVTCVGSLWKERCN